MTIATGTPSSAPGFDVASLESSSGFVKAAGLVLDEISESKVTGHIDLASEHHTPWGIVHGGVYSTAVESAASIGASAAVVGRGLVAVGLTNTTHFLRSLTGGRVTWKRPRSIRGEPTSSGERTSPMHRDGWSPMARSVSKTSLPTRRSRGGCPVNRGGSLSRSFYPYVGCCGQPAGESSQSCCRP
jgi:uncharacterized protein (TIGR00369 family)